MQAIRKYRNIEPHFDAPTPSSSRARVKLKPRPMKVASNTTHTNGLSRLTDADQLTLAANHCDSGPATPCAKATVPNATPPITIRSPSTGMRACCAW
ncbi:hypothetical protein D3C81_2008700 [compost metagenome]